MKITFSNKIDKKTNDGQIGKKYSFNLVNKFNFKSLILIAFVMFFSMPIISNAKPPLFKLKKTKIVKTLKRNAFDIEFGTFNYESPVVNKKSVFIG